MFISVLPPSLLDFLQAPVPFLIGMNTATFQFCESRALIPSNVVVVDINRDFIRHPSGVPQLPNHYYLVQDLQKIFAARKEWLEKGLRANSSASIESSGSRPIPPKISGHRNELRNAFLRLFAMLLASYTEVIRRLFLRCSPRLFVGRKEIICLRQASDEFVIF
jgi:hypothetical protein